MKNRCKSGGYYWVFTDITPIREKGNIVGYMSTRSAPDPQARRAAEAQYQLMREGRSAKPGLLERARWHTLKGRLRILSALEPIAILACLLFGALTKSIGVLVVGATWLVFSRVVLWSARQALGGLTQAAYALGSCDLKTQMPVTGPEEIQEAFRSSSPIPSNNSRV